MSLSRLMNCGSLIYNTVKSSIPIFSAFSGANVRFGQSTSFSSLCNSNRSLEPNKTNFNSFNPTLIHSRGLKVKGNLQLRCKNCYYVRKDGEMFVMCSSYPRHKQKLKTKKAKYHWILTHATQSKVRPY